jgi:hypothetical protein
MRSLAFFGAAARTLFECPLLFHVAVAVDTSAAKEAVTHHALAKQKNGDRQHDKKQDQANLEPGRILTFRGWRL